MTLPDNYADDSDKVRRGCGRIVGKTKEETCRAINGDLDVDHPDMCRLCITDQCNSGSNLIVSLAITLIPLFSILFMEM